MQLTAQVQEVVKQNLPAATAEALEEFFIQAKSQAEEVKFLSEQVEVNYEKLKKSQEEVAELKSLLKKQTELEAEAEKLERAKMKLEEKSRDLELIIKDVKLQEAQFRANQLHNLLSMALEK